MLSRNFEKSVLQWEKWLYEALQAIFLSILLKSNHMAFIELKTLWLPIPVISATLKLWVFLQVPESFAFLVTWE